MKKIFSSIALMCIALVMHAQVAYLIPVTDKSAAELTDTVAALPVISFGEVEQNPERNAYNWFHITYPTGQVFTLKDVKEGKLLVGEAKTPAVRALWIYVDRLNLAIADYDVLFNYEVHDALKAFVKAGGNLFTAGQAARVVSAIGRTTYWPGYASTNLQTNVTDTWFVTTDFCTGRDLRGHVAFVTCVGKAEKDGVTNAIFPLISNAATYNRTDNNNVWKDWNLYWKDYSGKDISEDNKVPGGCDPNLAKSLEESQNCQILGGWGHTRGLECAGFIEFFPNGEYKGTVMAMGLAAYQWSTQNTCANMQHLTEGVLDYLNTEVQKPVWNAGLPTTGVINSQFKLTATSNVSVSYKALTPEIANIGPKDGNVYCNYFGEAKFVATAGDGMSAPKVVSDTLTITVNGGSQEVDYAYVLPYSMHVMANWDNEDGQRPDFNAAEWFYNTYVKNGTGCFIRPADLATINEQVHTLWVNSDHVGLGSDTLLADLGGAAFVSALKTFVNKDNNVFLSKQATRLVGDLGRSAYPSYTNGGYADNRGDWRVGNCFAGVDYSTHSAFARTGKNPVILQKGRHTNNNNLFQELKNGGTIEHLNLFQTNNNCLVLGSWGNNETYECAGMVEFYPQEGCNGTILAMGLAAYHWGNANLVVRVYGDKLDENGNPVKDENGNVIQEVKEEKPMMAILTQDILYYLNIKEAPGFAWETAPANGVVGNTLQLAVEHKESALRYESSNTSVATVSETGLLTYVAEGNAIISAIRYGDGYKLPKNVKEAVISQDITVSKEGTSTSVENMTEQPAAEGIYDILGRRISTITTSGIYIVNGKKVVVNK
ncbi:MAG: Ig-like domain-containing protein [Paludibacteraceae bacterium]|nr:Ig-like domain-containing protein [Paludibacteraceae bacterium]